MSEEEQGKGFGVNDRRRFSPVSEGPQSIQSEENVVNGSEERVQPAEEQAQEAGPRGSPLEGDAEHAEITFSSFVLGLSTQALMYLGEVPAAPGQATQTDLTAAQQMIDVLAMLQQKTLGNLDTGEAQMLESVLYDLRMRYVKIKREGPAA